jgi:hypothetical protein
MAVTCGFTVLRLTPDTKPQVNAGCDVSEGGLEPLAYVAAAGTDPWLSL